MGTRLVVSVTTDAQAAEIGRRPEFSEGERLAMLRALECVSEAMLSPTLSAEGSLQAVRPTIYVKGPDYADQALDPTGRISEEIAAAKAVGAVFVATTGPTMSSTYARWRRRGVIDDDAHSLFETIRSRTSMQEMAEAVGKIESARVVVFGDPIIDEYVPCKVTGRSTKDPCIAVREEGDARFDFGGAYMCAEHARQLCPGVLYSAGTADGYSHDVPCYKKRRYIDEDFQQVLFSVSEPDGGSIFSEKSPEDVRLEEFDAVIVADYGHGQLCRQRRARIERDAKWLGTMVQANSANLGEPRYLRYAHNRHPEFVCQDRREVALCMAPDMMVSENWPAIYANGFREAVVTLGHRGSLHIIEGDTHEMPTLGEKVVDRTGAGDAYFVTAALFSWACEGTNPWLSGLAGLVAGGLHCEVHGNSRPIRRSDLVRRMRAVLMHKGG